MIMEVIRVKKKSILKLPMVASPKNISMFQNLAETYRKFVCTLIEVVGLSNTIRILLILELDDI
jgi:hypothetical protein